MSRLLMGMGRRSVLVTFVWAMVWVAMISATSSASERDRDILEHQRANGAQPGVLWGEPVTASKAVTDTIYLMGGDTSPNLGDFEAEDGGCSWDGWTSVDLTQRTEENWHCDTYNCQNLDPATVPNHAWWCGQYWNDDCDTGDFGGYGNAWEEYLAFYGTVPNPALATTVTVNAMLNYDNEPNYDYLYLEYETAAGWLQAATWNGTEIEVFVNQTLTVDPADYVGPAGDQVHLRWRFSSDGGWSDEDCLFTSLGAAQIDLIEVLFDQGEGPALIGVTETCEPGDPVQWAPELAIGVGDFAKLWPGLQDIDPCRSNPTCQAAFIDDGVVVPGTGGYLCTTYCYGPGGYIVNPEGGLAGPEFHIHNAIWSPVLQWPLGNYDGATFEFEVFRHETLSATAPGMFYRWHVRSTDSEDPADIAASGWAGRTFVYYGGPDYIRVTDRVTDLMYPGRKWVQISLDVYELGWVWGWNGTDGYPAPYYDNVSFRVYEFGGPGISTREIDIFQDNFPAIGTIDYANLGANSVRLDMANNISWSGDMRNDPGDSIIFDVVPVRTGSVLEDLPKLHYKLFANPVFNTYRTSGLPAEGWVYGDTTYSSSGSVLSDRYNFDLPDSGFFYPGDRLHYFIEGIDNVSGDLGLTRLPADTSGFSSAPGMAGFTSLQYPSSYVVRALPGLFSEAEGDQPKILWWNDFANRGGEQEWVGALNNLGYQESADYDLYYTNGPSSGVGNGLGGRATATQLAHYDVILYTAGDLSWATISNSDYNNDPSDDVGVLDAWLRQGGKDMFLTGDDLVFDLTQNGGSETLTFANTWIGVNFIGQDINPLIDGQTTPTIRALTGNSVFSGIERWLAYGGCLRFNIFDAVEAQTGVERLAEFLTPEGVGGQYPYSAATLKYNETYDARVISLPYDFMYIYTDASTPSDGSTLSARARILQEVLFHFGQIGSSPAVPVPEAGVFTVKSYPNPFNPATRIAYSLPQRGELRLRIYNLRGELVKTLLDEVRPAGAGHVIWDGSDDAGQAVASGVYFLETVALGEVRTSKLALVK